MDNLQLVRTMKMRRNTHPRSDFVEDMMSEIFLWLPLKSLIRFKRLSKRWCFLISDKDNSYFRRNYLSTLSTRRRNRIVGRSDDNSSAIMAGFFYRKPIRFGISYDQVRFLPYTSSTQYKKYSFLTEPNIQQQPAAAGDEPSTTTTTEITTINKTNPFLLSLVESLDEFISARLHEDEETYPPLHEPGTLHETFIKFLSTCLDNEDEFDSDERKISLAASSNGFLLFTLCTGLSHDTDYLVNPVTKEWLALPQLKGANGGCGSGGYIAGFVCKGDYPSLDLVEYTVVRLSMLERSSQDVKLLFQLFSSATGDNEWSEYRVSCKSLVGFHLWGQQDSVIVSSSTQGGGSQKILLYFLVTVRITGIVAIVSIDLNVGDESLKIFETPGSNSRRRNTVYYSADYIREFDDDGLIHYVRFCCSTDSKLLADFEFWILNTETGEWYLKHRASLKRMMMMMMMMTKGYTWSSTDVEKWHRACMCPKPYTTIARYHIHAFHPMNPNLIFLTLYSRFVCYNIITGSLELVFDFEAQNMMDDYNHFVYQWPCWPPLL